MASGKDELRSISSEEWGDIYKRLRLYTWKRYKWLHYKIGVDLDDFVNESIYDTLRGTRRWPPVDENGFTKDVSLFFFLCQVVQSKISHFWSRERHNVVHRIDQDNASEEAIESFETLLAESAHIYPGLRQTKGSDSDAIDNEFENGLRDVVAGDDELRRIVELIIEDPSLRPKEIAESLGLANNKVYTALKRLRRRLMLLRSEFKGAE
ncbi:MAG TPA: winged helix-turn-helix transcriptional regulator [Blastocatellia bacterium]|nr:winged helix-turn-helix transcriptional regulator [Blastocatellia bacterium]